MKFDRMTSIRDLGDGATRLAWLTALTVSLASPGGGSRCDAQAPRPRSAVEVPSTAPGPIVELPPALEDGPFAVQTFPALPTLTPMPPQPVASFIDRLRANDAAFEVIVGQGHILTTKEDITAGRSEPLIAVGDPSVIGFAVINTRQIRVTGLRVGVTDLSITKADGQTLAFEVRVVIDLAPLSARLAATFPDANLRLDQLRGSVIVEGQARDSGQVAVIVQTISAYLQSVQVGQATKTSSQQGRASGALPAEPPPGQDMPPPVPTAEGTPAPASGLASAETNPPLSIEGTIAPSQLINLIRLPGSQQVLLKVRVAELNRTALRRIGANFLGVNPSTGSIIGTQIANPVSAGGSIGQIQGGALTAGRKLAGAAANLASANSTIFGIFQDADFEFTLSALRQNSMLKVLAEPNLVALHGQQASFLAGGEFPVPVPQVSASGSSPTITVRFREFGVRLNFLPYILDNDVIRLSVAPEVSQIDFSIATTLVAGGSPVPGLNTRKAQTTVELREGQTLAIAGLMQLSLDGTTTRIPGLGDLPILGPFFSNTSSNRVEKELVVLVTPYLVEPLEPAQVSPSPGDEVKGPNDLELFFLNRIEGRTGKDFRATTRWDDPLHFERHSKLERRYMSGPSGFSGN
jgi:pilus assembly protein CpaC